MFSDFSGDMNDITVAILSSLTIFDKLWDKLEQKVDGCSNEELRAFVFIDIFSN